MQRKIQLIGLPGAGKTTAIQRYLKNTTKKIQYIDIATFPKKDKQNLFKTAIDTTQNSLIAESACGVLAENTYIIKLEPALQDIYVNCIRRDHYVDADYLSLLTGQMIPAHCTIGSTEELPSVLNLLFK